MQLLRRNPATQDIPVVFYELPEGEDHGVALELDFLAKPVAAAELARALARQGFEAGRCDGGRTILVVDDDPGILELHARLLEELAPKCRILKSHNGQEALELMARHRPDLVLLDLMMPVLDGFGVLEAMRQRELTRDVPVIVLTAQVLTGQDMARLQQGVAAVLSKGLFTGAEVLAQVTDALGRSKRLGGEAQRVVRQAMAYIHEHYTESFSREALAAAVGLNERYLTACFHQETGITPIAYLTRYRIQQARGLLERGELNITAVALTIGFGDPSYFARVFREEVGVTPRAYQRGERAEQRRNLSETRNTPFLHFSGFFLQFSETPAAGRWHNAPERRTCSTTPRDLPRSTHRKKLMASTCLIAEADPFIADLLLRFAEESGLLSVRASTGQEILTLAQPIPPDILIVEPELPGELRGWEAVRTIRSGGTNGAMAVIGCSWLGKVETCELIGDVAWYFQKPDLHYADFVKALVAAGVNAEGG